MLSDSNREFFAKYIEEFSDKSPDEAFEKIVSDSTGTIVIACKWIHWALTASAIIHLIATIIVVKRQQPTCYLAPIGSRSTRCSTVLVSLLNVLMIVANSAAIICFWKRNYSLSEYAPFMYSAASYGTLWFIITLLTVLGYGRGIFVCIRKRFLLFIAYYIIYGSVYGFFAWFVNSWLCGFIHWFVGKNMVLFLFVEVIIRTLFIMSGYTCMRKTVKKSETFHCGLV